jgi:hypothetical protein
MVRAPRLAQEVVLHRRELLASLAPASNSGHLCNFVQYWIGENPQKRASLFAPINEM